MKYTLIEAPISLGARTHGTEEAYSSLRGDLMNIFGDDEIRCAKFASDRVCAPEEGVKYRDEVMAAARFVYTSSKEARAKGSFPVVIGGDHSVAIGSLAAAAEASGEDELCVVWIDAHTDINTDRGSPSGYIHGMPLASAMGLCAEELSVGCKKPAIRGENTFVVGARSIDCEELPILSAEKVNLYRMEDVRKQGLDRALSEICEKLSGKALHVSFDVDCLDPAYFHSSGYIIENGFSPDEVIKIIRALANSANVISFDCVEYCPRMDDLQYSDRATVLKILREAEKAIRK